MTAARSNIVPIPPQASEGARAVDGDLLVIGGACTLILLMVGVLVGWFSLRYRAGSAADRAHLKLDGPKVEIAWAAVLTLVAIGMFLWGVNLYTDVQRPPRDAMVVYVVGQQWMWKVQHASGRREINELHVPTGRPVRLVLASQDVIHSFYVPAFRIKQDAVPGRYTSLWFTATRPGTYHLFCAEYCGADHSRMIGRVVVMRPERFQAWLGSGPEAGLADPGGPADALALRGEGPFFQYGCNACHMPGSSVRAPRLDGLFGSEVRLRNGRTVIADEQYIRESILRPDAKIVAGYPSPSDMPSYQGQISEEDLAALVEFIRSIRHGWNAEDGP